MGNTVNGSRYPDCVNCGGDGYSALGGPCPACEGTGREGPGKFAAKHER
jgi:RecJ-like exonuclease